jgi:hypothetical protein
VIRDPARQLEDRTQAKLRLASRHCDASRSPFTRGTRESRLMLRQMVLGGLVVVALVGSAASGQAQVSVSIGINLPAPPSFVIIPGTPVAYAPALPANYFFYAGHYYVFANSAWYLGPTYNGPWAVVPPAYVPLPILTVPVRYYRAPPPHWKHWKREAPPQWDPAWGGEWKKEHKEYERESKQYEKEQKQYEKERRAHGKEAQKEPHEEHGHGHGEERR